MSATTDAKHLDAGVDARRYTLRWWTLGFVSLALAIAAMDTTIVNVAVPEIQADLNASASAVQWILDSYYLVFAGLLLTMGALGDRFGRRALLQAGLLSFAGASLFAATAASSGQLIAARAITGIGAATLTPATLSIIIDAFPRHERAKAIAIWSAAAGVGVPIGQIAGGALLEQFAWGSIFFINLPLCAVIFIGTLTVISESRDPNARPIDPAGALLSTGMLSTFVFGVIEAPSRGWTDPVILGSLVIAGALGIAFALVELRLRWPMLDVRLLRIPGLSMGGVALAAEFLAMLGMLFLLTQYFQIGRGYSALETGLLLCPLPVGFAVGSGLGERWTLTAGANRVACGGLFLSALAMGALSFVAIDSSLWLIGIALLAFGLGGGAVMAPATAVMMTAMPEENAGVGGALTEAARVVGIALGVSILGSIATSRFSSALESGASGFGLPGETHLDSIGSAMRVAVGLPDASGQALAAAAQSAFVDGFSAAMVVGAALAALAGGAVWRWMPGRETTGTRVVGDTLGVPEGALAAFEAVPVIEDVTLS